MMILMRPEISDANVRVICSRTQRKVGYPALHPRWVATAPAQHYRGCRISASIDSEIWSPEYIKVTTRKKVIKCEEVILRHTPPTALMPKVKWSGVAAIARLSSDAARCIVGQTLVVDSG